MASTEILTPDNDWGLIIHPQRSWCEKRARYGRVFLLAGRAGFEPR